MTPLGEESGDEVDAVEVVAHSLSKLLASEQNETVDRQGCASTSP